MGVDGEGGPAVFTGVAAAAAGASALKMFWRLVSRSQVGCEVGVDDIVLAHFLDLLSFSRCVR